MDALSTSFFWVSLAQIIMINIVLSGDNAVVIALASRSLPAKQQKQAIMFGSVGAIVLRIILTYFAVLLLGVPWLKIVGAVLLAWIGIQMLAPEGEEEEIDGHSHLWAAIKTIIVADFIMSLDNVLGVAAAAKGSLLLLVVGLAISIPIIVYGSTLVLKAMTRFPIIVTIGGGVLGWVAGEMLVSDPVLKPWMEGSGKWLHSAAPALGAAFVVLVGKTHAALTVAAAKRALEGGEPEAAPAQVPGYRWHGSHEAGAHAYANFCSTGGFRVLRPVSSRMRSAGRWQAFSRG
ncbi:MAG TPA: TerC family protein [Usitatibacteraceae bacterium]|nr:TerC family protein [Usitatibacteraceae bacterium]